MNKEFKSCKYKVTTGFELIEKNKKEPLPKFLWYGIPEGSTGLLAGVAKTGKTTFAENLAISLAVGRKNFFGYNMDGRPRKVLFLNLEESYRIRCNRNRKQLKGLSNEELELFKQNYFTSPENFPEFIIEEEDWMDMAKYILSTEAEVIFIDSLTHMFKGEIEKSKPCIDFFKTFRKHLLGLNKTIIIVHHNTKGNNVPINQDSIAGSRIVIQEFQFAIGFGNIPNQKGGNYCCMLLNKYIPKNDTEAVVYKINKYGWFVNEGLVNKYNLYSNHSIDLRENPENKNKILSFIENQVSQGNKIIKTKLLKDNFIINGTFSNDTLFVNLKKLIEENKVIRFNHGEYGLIS